MIRQKNTKLLEALKRIEALAKQEKEFFLDEHKKVEALARSIKILILADHKEDKPIIEKIVKSLVEKHHHVAVPLKSIARKGNHIHSEKVALKRYQVIVKIDGHKPGSVGENLLIVNDKNYQEKTILLIKESPDVWNRILGIEEYLLYFPRIYTYKNDRDMVKKATHLAIKETYRLVYTALQKNMIQDLPSLNKNENNDKHVL